MPISATKIKLCINVFSKSATGLTKYERTGVNSLPYIASRNLFRSIHQLNEASKIMNTNNYNKYMGWIIITKKPLERKAYSIIIMQSSHCTTNSAYCHRAAAVPLDFWLSQSNDDAWLNEECYNLGLCVKTKHIQCSYQICQSYCALTSWVLEVIRPKTANRQNAQELSYSLLVFPTWSQPSTEVRWAHDKWVRRVFCLFVFFFCPRPVGGHCECALFSLVSEKGNYYGLTSFTQKVFSWPPSIDFGI